MKKLFTILAAVLLTASVFLPGWQASAQSPQKMSYQAVIRNSSNALVTSTAVGMQISILQDSPTGTIVYTETQTPTTNANGLVTIEIGGMTGFDTINWASGPYFIKTETDPAGGTTYTITGTSQLLSVPYALHSKTAENLSGGIIETQNLADVIAINNSADAQIKNVSNPTDEQDAATKAYVDVLQNQLTILQNTINVIGIVTDTVGNVYNTVKIGTQVWMAENLKTTKYNDGTAIPLVTDNGAWDGLTTGAYCWYNNDSITSENPYGKLYNWYVVNTGDLCPIGWHVPTDDECTILINYLGGESVAGGKLKETGTTHWKSPNTGATNERGFTSLPSGYRPFGFIGSYGFWWSSTESSTSKAWCTVTQYNSSGAYRVSNNKINGFSVRCLQD